MEQIQNTALIQIQSVINFMQELGFTFYPNEKVFESVAYETNKANKVISFNTAIRLHNNIFTGWNGNCYYFHYPFNSIPVEWIAAAKQAKIVTSVSLQHSRRKGIICQKMWVRFAPTENGELFKAKYV